MTQFSPELLAALQEAMSQAQTVKTDPRRFASYRDKPVEFAQDILGVHTLWPKQKEILEAIVGNRRVAVRSGHGTGKTFVLAIAVIWWVYARRGLVITTASTWSQVERVLWREIGTLWRNALVPLPGQNFATELRVEKDWYALGLSVDNPTAFHGTHHPDLLAVLDEAPGIADPIHDAVASLTTATGNRTVMIGNPTDPSGAFFRAFDQDLGWEQIHISCLEHPNVVTGKELIPGAVTREWVEERKMEYGEDSPLYSVRVLGDFPASSDNQLLSRASVEQAMQRTGVGQGPIIMGVDVARYGSNRSVALFRQGDVVWGMEDWQGTATTETAARVRMMFAEAEITPDIIIVDETGVGGGVVDQLLQMGLPVMGFNAGARPSQPDRFDNLRSEGWWRLKERLTKGQVVLPDHDQLRRDLIAPTYSFTPTGKIRAERKDQMRRRGLDSPDFADAVMMAFAVELLDPQLTYGEERQRIELWADTSRDPAVIGQGGGYEEIDGETLGGIPSEWF